MRTDGPRRRTGFLKGWAKIRGWRIAEGRVREGKQLVIRMKMSKLNTTRNGRLALARHAELDKHREREQQD